MKALNRFAGGTGYTAAVEALAVGRRYGVSRRWAEAADGLGGSADHSEAHRYWWPHAGVGVEGSGGA